MLVVMVRAWYGSEHCGGRVLLVCYVLSELIYACTDLHTTLRKDADAADVISS